MGVITIPNMYPIFISHRATSRSFLRPLSIGKTWILSCVLEVWTFKMQIYGVISDIRHLNSLITRTHVIQRYSTYRLDLYNTYISPCYCNPVIF